MPRARNRQVTDRPTDLKVSLTEPDGRLMVALREHTGVMYDAEIGRMALRALYRELTGRSWSDSPDVQAQSTAA